MSGTILSQYESIESIRETHLGTESKEDRLSDCESRLVDCKPLVVSL